MPNETAYKSAALIVTELPGPERTAAPIPRVPSNKTAPGTDAVWVGEPLEVPVSEGERVSEPVWV